MATPSTPQGRNHHGFSLEAFKLARMAYDKLQVPCRGDRAVLGISKVVYITPSNCTNISDI